VPIGKLLKSLLDEEHDNPTLQKEIANIMLIRKLIYDILRCNIYWYAWTEFKTLHLSGNTL